MSRYLAHYEAQLKALLSIYGLSLPNIYSYLRHHHHHDQRQQHQTSHSTRRILTLEHEIDSDETAWDIAAAKGRAFVRMFSMPTTAELQAYLDTLSPHRRIPAASPWTEPSALELWNWTPEYAQAMYDEEGFARLFARDLHARIEDNVFVCMSNTEPTVIDGMTYPATGAWYSNLYNTASGIIIADNLMSPMGVSRMGAGEFQEEGAGLINSRLAPSWLIHLKQWSDVTFLMWTRLAERAGVQVDSIRYIFHAGVSNPLTKQVVRRALARAGQSLGGWDRVVTFPVEDDSIGSSEEGTAILGTPNGSATGWFIAQHREQLGRRKVVSVSVFGELGTPVSTECLSLYFTLDEPQR
ncbi:uncharacterized protein BO95DRAFT_515005 [Aspergillus brunneoviolaceus CBS 621.78]|uniref:Uncharacterized protein n=1 Tax=Aspergillus brunneoviolaceus CBS 621.78 TaxID=1450534 RepID=A0ACD1G755_9EURO|nr:hypothetical protein BO95DRAFT_515005 [Aspergillus brunneoviolaceus CBS 621.78]RAH45047.1 hypothetical protein BO95DRAFT_515005 [Aspergillus brunneoviolaceus CBS 621.78]